jgi:flagellar biosynthesis component FlhA
VRRERAGALCRKLRDPDGRLVVVRLTARAAEALVSDRAGVQADGRAAARVMAHVRRAVAPRIDRGAAAVVVVPGAVRQAVRDRLVRHVPRVRVLAEEEVAVEGSLVVFATVGDEEVARAA